MTFSYQEYEGQLDKLHFFSGIHFLCDVHLRLYLLFEL